MATVYLDLPASAFVPAASAGAAPEIVYGTNFPVPSLRFDAAADEAAFADFAITNYGSGNLTATVFWYADTASSGDVIWGAQLAAITPNGDSQDVETKAFAAASTATDSHLGTTGQRLHAVDITLSNLDSLASGDEVRLRVYRDAGGDTMAGDAHLVRVLLSWSDT